MSEWILIAAAGALAAADTTAFFQGMIHQPLVISTLLGAALGLPAEGAYAGALLQLLWISELPIGAAVFPDVGSVSAGAAGGVLLAAEAGTGLGEAGAAALLLSIPLASAAGRLVSAQREFQGLFLPRVYRAVERGRPGLLRWYLAVGVVHSLLRGALVATGTALLVRMAASWAGGQLPAGAIPPYTLLAGMLAAGLVMVWRLLDEGALLPWVLAGAAVGTMGVMLL
ncbi:MAG: PTS sugar transporter subunit IIC [bacterium]